MSDARPAPGRRFAALAALVGLVAALLSVGFAIIRGDAWRLPVVLVAVGAGVVGLWYLVSRRGAPSAIGGLVAGAGLVTLFLVVLTGDYHGLPFVVAIAWIAVSAGAARYALGRDTRTLRSASEPDAPVASPQHPVLLMNPKSGGGKAERYRLAEECAARGIEPIVLQPGDDLRQLAEDAIRRGADVIGMAGGDGSQALVASVAAEHGVPHVCVPAGTRNHFALDLGIDRDDVVGALDAYFDGVERRVDLARVNGRVFVNNASMGIYAKIVQSDAYRDAKLKTAADMLPDLLGPEAKPFDLRFTGPAGSEYQTAHLLLVSNNPYELDHIGGRGTRRHMDLGTLGIVAARIGGPGEAVTFVALEAAGRIRTFQGWMEWDAPTFTIDSGGPIEIGIDGEAMRLEPPLLFESLPGALRVRIPGHAVGVAPAASSVHLTGSTVRALVLTAAGRAVDDRTSADDDRNGAGAGAGAREGAGAGDGAGAGGDR
jgi:diacylglycerol kinase family enzyme